MFVILQMVVNAIIHSIPAIGNIFLFCVVFWLIFSIAGVQLFAGTFYYCKDSSGNIIDDSVVPNKSVCATYSNYTWVNAKVTFDNVLWGYLALLYMVCICAVLNVLYIFSETFLAYI